MHHNTKKKKKLDYFVLHFGIRVEPNTWVDSLEVNHQSTKVE